MAQLGEELEEPDIGRTERRREENLRDGVGQWRCQIDAFWSDVGEWMGLGFILLEDNAIKLVGQNFCTKSRSPLHAEAESLMWTMQKSQHYRYAQVHFESDCQQLLNILNREEEWPSLAP